MDEENKIQCNWCGWHGNETEIIYNDDENLERCPKCKATGYLMDIE